jgi:putative DNA primase/helicase
MSMTPIELTNALGGDWRISHGVALCPAHKDRTPSLSIGEGRAGKVLVKCWAGCDQQRVIAALRQKKLWPARDDDSTVASDADRESRDRGTEEKRKRRDEFIDRLWRKTWANAQ